LSSHVKLPTKGEVFFSLREKDKEELLEVARGLVKMGYSISGTRGTADFFESHGIKSMALRKVHEGRPHCVDRIRDGHVAFVVNTAKGRVSIDASFNIRRACTDLGIPCITESDAAEAFLLALTHARSGALNVGPLRAMEVL